MPNKFRKNYSYIHEYFKCIFYVYIYVLFKIVNYGQKIDENCYDLILHIRFGMLENSKLNLTISLKKKDFIVYSYAKALEKINRI